MPGRRGPTRPTHGGRDDLAHAQTGPAVPPDPGFPSPSPTEPPDYPDDGGVPPDPGHPTPAPPPPPATPPPVEGERPCIQWVFFDVFITRQDERVCAVCGPMHGREFEQGTGPYPPLHGNCRCARIMSRRECVMRDRGPHFPRE